MVCRTIVAISIFRHSWRSLWILHCVWIFVVFTMRRKWIMERDHCKTKSSHALCLWYLERRTDYKSYGTSTGTSTAHLRHIYGTSGTLHSNSWHNFVFDDEGLNYGLRPICAIVKSVSTGTS
jgi:hypothetical protein